MFKILFYFFDMLIKKTALLLFILALYKKETYNPGEGISVKYSNILKNFEPITTIFGNIKATQSGGSGSDVASVSTDEILYSNTVSIIAKKQYISDELDAANNLQASDYKTARIQRLRLELHMINVSIKKAKLYKNNKGITQMIQTISDLSKKNSNSGKLISSDLFDIFDKEQKSQANYIKQHKLSVSGDSELIITEPNIKKKQSEEIKAINILKQKLQKLFALEEKINIDKNDINQTTKLQDAEQNLVDQILQKQKQFLIQASKINLITHSTDTDFNNFAAIINKLDETNYFTKSSNKLRSNIMKMELYDIILNVFSGNNINIYKQLESTKTKYDGNKTVINRKNYIKYIMMLNTLLTTLDTKINEIMTKIK